MQTPRFVLAAILSFVSLNVSARVHSDEFCIIRLQRSDIENASSSLGVSIRDLDIIADRPETGEVDVRLSSHDCTRLRDRSLAFSVIVSSEAYRDLRIDEQYLDPGEVASQLQALETTYPAIVKRYRIGNSFEARDIWAVKISDSVQSDEDEPSVLITGLHQAREIMGVEIAVDMAQFLASNYSGNPTVRNWVDNLEIWIVPLVNPDGNSYCWSLDPYWIKNRRDNGDGTFGVDLGHNYPFRWGECYGSSDYPGSSAYRGASAASEPEVQAIINLVETQAMNGGLSYNSFDELVLMPYGCHGQYPSEKTAFRSIGNTIAAAIQRESGVMGYGFGTWWEELYPNDGVESDWFCAAHGMLAFSIEVNTSYQPPYSVRQPTVQRNRAGWQAFLTAMLTSGQIRGHIRNACTQEPIAAVIDVIQCPLNPGESPRKSDQAYGRYQRFLGPGTYTVLVSAEGYAPVEQRLTLASGPVDLDFDLIPLDAYGLIYADHIVDDFDGDHDFNLDPGEESMLGIALTAPGLDVSGISAHISTSDPYITVVDPDASYPDLFSGMTGWAQGDCFRVQAAVNAPENHSALITIDLSTNEQLCISSIDFELIVQGYSYQCPIWSEYLDSNPHWTIYNGDAYGWEFGAPVIGPAEPYSGQFVYGTNLDGNYSVGPYRLTSPPIDCSSIQDTELKYQRFLQNEEYYDLARVDLSTNGTAWYTIWSGYASDFDWVSETIDISSHADGQPSVWIRFSLIPDSNSFFPGFYIDDIMICGMTEGVATPPPTPTPIPSGTVPATRTPTPSPTHSGATPTPNPSSTPTPTPTASPPSATPTPAVSPTSTATTTTETFNLDLSLNDTDYSEGELFNLELRMSRIGHAVTVDLYIILDVYGQFFFHDAWTQTPECEVIEVSDGFSSHRSILTFIWPSGTGSASDLGFWAGCVVHDTATILGEIDHVTFSYH